MRRIVVLGTGFGGLHAIAPLERALGARRRTHLTVVTDQSYFLFTPLLPNVATKELDLKSITLDVRDSTARDTEVIIDRVTEIDLKGRTLHAERHTIPFDYLLLAPGAQVDWRGHDVWRPFALTCKSAQDATLIRETLERAVRAAAGMPPEARKRHLTFVFAGAGPTGVELAAELHTHLAQEVFPRAAPEIARDTRFIIIDPGPKLLAELPPQLRKIAANHLEEKGIEVRLETAVTHREAGSVGLSDGAEIPCDHFFWCAGVKPSSLIEDIGLELDESGRALVDETLQATGHEGVFIVGDAACTPALDPQTAQAAKQQGPVAAHNILAALSGRAPRPFRMRHLGDMITLGRGRAAVTVMGVAVEGLPAYAMYRVAYAGLMPNTMKKFRIIADWLEHDLTSAAHAQRMLER